MLLMLAEALNTFIAQKPAAPFPATAVLLPWVFCLSENNQKPAGNGRFFLLVFFKPYVILIEE